MKKTGWWLPRILTIIYILFLAMFAFDAFEGDQSAWKKAVGFLIHLIPNFVLIVILILSWRREWIGGLLFNVLGLLYIFMSWGKFPLVTYLAVSGPLFLTGILFLINWSQRRKNA